MKMKFLRQQLNKSQLDVANDLKIPRTMYARYETNESNPKVETLIKIADYFGVSLDYLCERQYNNQIGYIPDEKRETVNELLELGNKEFEKAQVYIKALKDMNN